MSQEKLDQACEQHLAANFGQEVDFAIERSLPELLDVGLVTVQDVRPPLSWRMSCRVSSIHMQVECWSGHACEPVKCTHPCPGLVTTAPMSQSTGDAAA